MVDTVATLDVANLPRHNATRSGSAAGASGIKEHTSPPNLRSQDDLGQPLRLLSAAAGGAMVWFGLRDPSPVRLLLAVVGSGLVYQGISGKNVAAAVAPKDVRTGGGRSSVISHRLRLDDAPEGYKMFRDKQGACTKVVLQPGA